MNTRIVTMWFRPRQLRTPQDGKILPGMRHNLKPTVGLTVCHAFMFAVRSGALLLEDLSIEPGVHAWKLCMDIVCLSFDGNVADAGLVAAMAALMRLKLPATLQIGDELFITEGERWHLDYF